MDKIIMKLSRDEINLAMNHREQMEIQRVQRVVDYYQREKNNERRGKTKQGSDRREEHRSMASSE